MKRVIRKVKWGWHCDLCNLGISGRQDAPVHLRDSHDVPEEYIIEQPNGDLCDGRQGISLDRSRKAGL